ncbi:hypothetical protein [Haloterrigena salifodinae]|uniref:hypothetical protein n=1 Tax=Haloterrigena salifodinae TaxID=2675099 RepID=UPI000F89C2AF|nr:hypothetical protein [Haloterrigena salifodinae]
MTNDTSQEAKIPAMSIDPDNDAVNKLRDYSDGKGKSTNELFVDADVQDSLTEIHDGTSLTSTIDLETGKRD